MPRHKRPAIAASTSNSCVTPSTNRLLAGGASGRVCACACLDTLGWRSEIFLHALLACCTLLICLLNDRNREMLFFRLSDYLSVRPSVRPSTDGEGNVAKVIIPEFVLSSQFRHPEGAWRLHFFNRWVSFLSFRFVGNLYFIPSKRKLSCSQC